MTTNWKLPTVATNDRATVYQAVNADALRLKDGYRSLYSACQAAYPIAFGNVSRVLVRCKASADAQLAASKFICNLAVGAVLFMIVGPIAGKFAGAAMGKALGSDWLTAHPALLKGGKDFASSGAKKLGAWGGSQAINAAMKPDLSPFSVGEDPLVFITNMGNALANFEQRIDVSVSERDGAGGKQLVVVAADSIVELKNQLSFAQKGWPDVPTTPEGTETWTKEHLVTTLTRSLWLAWIMARDTKWWFKRASTLYGDGDRPYFLGQAPRNIFDQLRINDLRQDEWLFRYVCAALTELKLPGKFFNLELFLREERKVGYPSLGESQRFQTVWNPLAEYGLNVANLILWAQPTRSYARDWLKSDLKGAVLAGSDIPAALRDEIAATQGGKKI